MSKSILKQAKPETKVSKESKIMNFEMYRLKGLHGLVKSQQAALEKKYGHEPNLALALTFLTDALFKLKQQQARHLLGMHEEAGTKPRQKVHKRLHLLLASISQDDYKNKLAELNSKG